jgi:two-component system cell cycle sensor histidine kinase/response regulator CckA
MSTALHLLILEDDSLDAELEIATLEEAGYTCQWERVETQAEFLACLDTPDYDVILADYNLPAFDGLTALDLYLERDLDLPFIFVSGTMGEETAIESLKAGATDYVLKEHLSRLGPVVKRALHEREDHRKRRRVEEELQKSQLLLTAIIDHSPAAIQVKDLQGRYLLINNQIETIFDLQRGEAIGKTPHDIFPQEIAKKFLADDQTALRSRTAVQTEETIPFPDGMHTFIALKFPLVDASGEPYAVAGIATDITEQKRVEEALRDSRRRLRAIFDQTFEFMGVMTPKGILTEANQTALDFAGLKESDVIGKPFWETPWWTHSPELQEQLREAIAKAASGEFVRFEANHLAADGSLHYADFSLKPVRDETGNVSFLIPEGRDITERKRVEENLRRERDLKNRITETSPVGIAMLDREGQITFANSRAKQLLGLEKDESTQRTYNDPEWRITDYNGDPFPDEQLPFARVMATGRPVYNVHHAIEWPDGRRVLLSINAAPLLDETGQIDGMVATVDDVTQQVQAEEALQESERRFRNIVESTPLGMHMYRLDPDGKLVFTDANPAADRILGVDNSQFVGKTIEEAFPALTQTEVPQAYRQVAATGQVWQTDQITYEEGQIAGAFEVYAFQTSPGKMTAAFLDITDRKQAAEALATSEATLRSIFRAAPVGIGLVKDRVFQWTNETLHQMLGYAEEELKGQSARMVYPSQEEYERVGRVKYGAIAERGTGSVETRWQRKDGGIIDIILSSTPLDPADLSKGVTFTALDITERKRAEEAVKESQESLARAQSIAHLGGWEWDMVAQKTTWSDENYRLSGYEPGDFEPTFEKFLETVHPDDRDMILQKLSDIQEGKIAHDTYEYRIVLPDGTERWLEGQLDVISDGEGQPVTLAGTNLDITERKQAEAALHLTQFCVDRASVGIMRTGSDAQILSVNDQMCRALGYTAEELCTMHVYDIDPNFPLDKWRKHRERLCARGSDTFETVHQRKDGTTFPVEITNNYIEFQSSGFSISFTQDITERKQAEEERERLLSQVQEQAQRVQQIVETVPEGVILLDIKNRVIMANPLGRKDLAVLADTLTGGTLTRLGEHPLPEFLTSPPQGLWHEVSAEGRTFQVIARPIETGPTPGGWVLVIRDITQQREIERRVHQQERLAAVGQLAAGIAHDFNNIMAVISLYAGMSLRTAELPEKIYERLETIDQQAHRASDLIQQILDFSRRAVLERLPMELGMFLKEQVKLLRRTLPENIKIDLIVGSDEYMVNADLTRVQQMIMNLATNARDSMPEGGQLHIGLEKVWIASPQDAPLPDMEPGEWVRVTVADTGCGIPADVLPHIYDPFFTTKPVGMGTGLGLSQVYGIVKQHKGYIDVKSQKGEGATFTIYLPSLAQLQPETVYQETEALVQGQGQLILVVEDDAATRAALVDSLELLNYRVIETANGREALSIFEQRTNQADAAEQISLVLSDMVMPEMGGRALLHALRERSETAKIILLTGHPLDEETFEDLKPHGLQDWLLKPLSIERLSQTVAQALEGKDSEE